MPDAQLPLSWEGSANSMHTRTSTTLPQEVVTCLENARFLHLATCTDLHPHVSLMNYTYLHSHPFPATQPSQLPAGPFIIMTTNPSSRKTVNLISNPNVSLLVHDWVSHRPPNLSSERAQSPDGRRGGQPRRSSLANLLMGMNTSALSSISATINGTASVLRAGSEEEEWCKQCHLDNNTFEEEGGGATDGGPLMRYMSPGDGQSAQGENAGGRGHGSKEEEVMVVVVRIRDGRIADWKGGVKDWVIAEGDSASVNGM
ncbi:hypothetical protein LTR66_003463 [Elasticomyces elasticus]|nr:hypothetical protein LTR66_003463 [Elasticomyces elasticus]